jgi:hypothetical protein
MNNKNKNCTSRNKNEHHKEKSRDTKLVKIIFENKKGNLSN